MRRRSRLSGKTLGGRRVGGVVRSRTASLVNASLVLLFLGSCAGMVPVSMLALDPLTRSPIGDLAEPFPVAVVAAEGASVKMVKSANGFGDPGGGQSYLIPDGQDGATERQLRERDPLGNRHASWVLRVRRLSVSRQRIELYRLGDGFWGGVYDATATQITPLYRKVTGPGFAFVSGPLALGLNLGLWGMFWLIRRWYPRRARRDGAA